MVVGALEAPRVVITNEAWVVLMTGDAACASEIVTVNFGVGMIKQRLTLI